MTRLGGWIAASLLLALGGAPAQAQGVTAPVANPVDHPLVAARPVRTAGAWRQAVEGFGESLARGSLRLRGYDVLDGKLAGNHGIDLVAVKRCPAGALTDVRLVEVKAHHGPGKPRLGQTRVGTQMSRQWLADRLRALRASGAQGRKLALEVARFRKATGIPLVRLGEVHDVNLRTGTYTVRDPVSLAGRAGPRSIRLLLKDFTGRSTQPAYRAWAIRHLSRGDPIQRATMGSWLGASPSGRAFERASSTQIALLEEKQALRGARQGLLRAAGRMAVAAALAVEALELYGQFRDCQLGKLSRRQFVTALARGAGGFFGFAGGAWAGAQIGAFGGPWAWVTVPVGFMFGGFAGYFGGSAAGEFTAQAWYRLLDRDVRDRVSGWLKRTPNPDGK